jgi:hypothetical protein
MLGSLSHPEPWQLDAAERSVRTCREDLARTGQDTPSNDRALVTLTAVIDHR